MFVGKAIGNSSKNEVFFFRERWVRFGEEKPLLLLLKPEGEGMFGKGGGLAERFETAELLVFDLDLVYEEELNTRVGCFRMAVDIISRGKS